MNHRENHLISCGRRMCVFLCQTAVTALCNHDY